MNKLCVISLLLILSISSYAKITISNSIYKQVPFSSQFIEDGALIRNVNYNAIKELIPQLENKYGIKLESRGEAHITTISPPEAQGWFLDHKGINYLISSIEIHQKYFSTLQNTKFKIVCVGKRKSDKGNIVFYLVVDSRDLFTIREEIQKELERRALFTDKKTNFSAKNFWPHITIGYVGGDVHGVSKGTETCIEDLNFTN